MAEYPEAQFTVRVRAREISMNCVHTMFTNEARSALEVCAQSRSPDSSACLEETCVGGAAPAGCRLLARQFT